MNITTLEDTISAWADAQTTFPIMWADQNAPRPSAPYFSLRIQSIIRIGQDFVGLPDVSTELTTIVGNREITVEVQAYGAGTSQEIENMRTSLSKITVQDALRAGGLSYVDATATTNFTIPLDSRMEQRRLFEVTFRTPEEVTDATSIIETVNVDLAVKDATGATVVSDTITVEQP